MTSVSVDIVILQFLIASVLCYDINSSSKPFRSGGSFSTSTSKGPFYIIAHMANTGLIVEEFLNQGANAVEIDIQFNLETFEPEWCHHGPPCQCLRTDCLQRDRFDEMLWFLRKLSNPESFEYNPQLTLVMLDIKNYGFTVDQNYQAGYETANSIIANYYLNGREKPDLYFIVTLSSFVYKPFVQGFLECFRNHELEGLVKERFGWDFHSSNPLRNAETLHGLNLTNVWQADGSTSCFFPYKTLSRMAQCLELRDKYRMIQKVYLWTFDSTYNVELCFENDVDAVITNQPFFVLKTMNEGFSSRYRLATKDDNPFKSF